VITSRATRLVRVGSPQAFREAAISLATQGSPLDARARLVIVPVLSGEGAFSAFLARDAILFRRQLLAPFLVRLGER